MTSEETSLSQWKAFKEKHAMWFDLLSYAMLFAALSIAYFMFTSPHWMDYRTCDSYAPVINKIQSGELCLVSCQVPSYPYLNASDFFPSRNDSKAVNASGAKQ